MSISFMSALFLIANLGVVNGALLGVYLILKKQKIVPDTVWKVSIKKYASWYARRVPGKSNGRTGSIVAIDKEKDVAYAKLQFIIPAFGKYYSALLLSKKIQQEWKVISKCTSAELIPRSPQEMIV